MKDKNLKKTVVDIKIMVFLDVMLSLASVVHEGK
jgi:hypothetical protein